MGLHMVHWVKSFVGVGHGQGTRVSLDHLEGDTGVKIDPRARDWAGLRDINPINTYPLDEAFAFLIFSSLRDFYWNSEDWFFKNGLAARGTILWVSSFSTLQEEFLQFATNFESLVLLKVWFVLIVV